MCQTADFSPFQRQPACTVTVVAVSAELQFPNQFQHMKDFERLLPNTNKEIRPFDLTAEKVTSCAFSLDHW